jgi:hypothetical protein
MHNEDLSTEEKAVNADTWQHINLVMKLLASAQIELMRRQFTHDRSKLVSPEVSTFVEFTPKLKTSTYGSDEYKSFLAAMKPALDNHYAHNRHHPEFFPAREPSPEIALAIDTLFQSEVFAPDAQWRYERLCELLEGLQAQHTSPVNGMNLFDVLEMFIDWYAASQRHDDGDINKSIEINKERFSLSPQLVEIFKNTVPWIKDEFANLKTQKDIQPPTV